MVPGKRNMVFTAVENRPALSELEAQLQATLNLVPTHAWYAAPNGALRFLNERSAEYGGLPKDHPLRYGAGAGDEWDLHVAFLHPEDRDKTRRVWADCLRTGRAGEVTFRARGADGGYRWFLSRAEPVRDGDGRVLHWIGVNLDIEERKQAEFYLAEGQRLAHTGSWAFTPAGFEYWSSELFQIHGLDPTSKVPTREEYLALVHPEDQEFVSQIITKMFGEGAKFDFTKRIVRPDGAIRTVRCVGVPWADGVAPPKFVGTAIDVTDQEQMVEALLRREAYLSEAERLSHTGSFGWKPDTGEIIWSEESYRLYEWDHDEKPTLTGLFERLFPGDKTLAHQVVDGLSKINTDFEHECRLVMPSGATKYLHVRAHPVRNSSGSVEIVGAVTDVSVRKIAEETIRMQEAELRQILDLTPQLIAVYGPNRERLYANRIALNYAGLTLEQWRQTEARGAFTHPDDRERELVYFAGAVSDGLPGELELRIRAGDGSYRWFLARYNAVRDHNGQILRWHVSCTDIEDRKRSEDRLQQENVALREEIDKASMFEEIVGTSPALQTVLSRISKVAPTDSTVLITGETGTGKELVARAIHRRSNRASRAFVCVNCAAIPHDLITSELFGHEKGAFTGALQRRVGRFELAEGGTIFLDEVGELLPDTQVALLRVLQEREFERVGGRQPIRVDVRVVAATNRDLKAAVAKGTFREDLYYRLNVFPIEMPPLRARRADIPLLVEYFIDRYARKAGKNIRHVDKKTLQLLQSYPWPGNIRELQNVIERSLIVCETEIFTVDESWLSQRPLDTRREDKPFLAEKVAATEREIIEEALRESQGRIFGPSGAAAKLGIARSTLESKIRLLNINKNRFKTSPGA